MPLVRVGSITDLPPGCMLEVTLGEDSYIVCNVEGKLHAVSGVCPHRDGPLGQGSLHGHHIECPWHAWEWDCRTGECVHDRAQRIPCYQVKNEGGDILLWVPESRA
ncbi:MAG: Rieske (2Fe-2S) protein [Bryobacterales bacterium]|nr:Rieske (2Fe-2S) protein [Bryobacterales bacterium]